VFLFCRCVLVLVRVDAAVSCFPSSIDGSFCSCTSFCSGVCRLSIPLLSAPYCLSVAILTSSTFRWGYFFVLSAVLATSAVSVLLLYVLPRVLLLLLHLLLRCSSHISRAAISLFPLHILVPHWCFLWILSVFSAGLVGVRFRLLVQ